MQNARGQVIWVTAPRRAMGASGIVVVLWGAFLVVFGAAFVANAVADIVQDVPALVPTVWFVLLLLGGLLTGFIVRTLAMGRAWVPMMGIALGDAGGYVQVARLFGWRTVRLPGGEPPSIEVVLQRVHSRWGLLRGSRLHMGLRVFHGSRGIAFVGFSGVTANLDWLSWCAMQREALPGVLVTFKDLRSNEHPSVA